jgi:hypothetical protein
MGAPGPRERVEFQGSKTTRHHLLSFRCVCFGGFGTMVPAIGIHTDFIATGPAQEIVDRYTKALTSNVPEGLFDTADGAIQIHRPTLPSKIVVCHVGKMLDVQGRTFDKITTELVHMRDDALITISLRVTFSPAADAITRRLSEKEPVYSSIVAVGAMKGDNDASLLSRLVSHSYRGDR